MVRIHQHAKFQPIFHMFSRKCPETTFWPVSWKLKCCQNKENQQGSTLSFLAGCPKSHFLGWYRNFLVYWYSKLDNQVVNSTCLMDKLGWIWRADDPLCRTLINRPWPKCNQFQWWSGYISTLSFRPFLQCVRKKMPGHHKFVLSRYM